MGVNSNVDVSKTRVGIKMLKLVVNLGVSLNNKRNGGYSKVWVKLRGSEKSQQE